MTHTVTHTEVEIGEAFDEIVTDWIDYLTERLVIYHFAEGIAIDALKLARTQYEIITGEEIGIRVEWVEKP